eukprot:7508283-Pyramimonas_sp.AAC.1
MSPSAEGVYVRAQWTPSNIRSAPPGACGHGACTSGMQPGLDVEPRAPEACAAQDRTWKRSGGALHCADPGLVLRVAAKPRARRRAGRGGAAGAARARPPRGAALGRTAGRP